MRYEINGITVENFKIVGNIPQWLQTKANAIARKARCGSASEILIGNERRVVKHIRYGFRKYTTGEYVPNKYRANFGWKNTYYQHAITTVSILPEDLKN